MSQQQQQKKQQKQRQEETAQNNGSLSSPPPNPSLSLTSAAAAAASSNNNNSADESSKSMAGIKLKFPLKLQYILLDAEDKGFENIISWLPDGKSFKIHDREKFIRLVMPQYFTSSNFKSFQRNLNLWGFDRVNIGSQRGAYHHEYFCRHEPNLCRFMVRETKRSENVTKPYDSNNSIASSSSINKNNNAGQSLLDQNDDDKKPSPLQLSDNAQGPALSLQQALVGTEMANNTTLGSMSVAQRPQAQAQIKNGEMPSSLTSYQIQFMQKLKENGFKHHTNPSNDIAFSQNLVASQFPPHYLFSGIESSTTNKDASRDNKSPPPPQQQQQCHHSSLDPVFLHNDSNHCNYGNNDAAAPAPSPFDLASKKYSNNPPKTSINNNNMTSSPTNVDRGRAQQEQDAAADSAAMSLLNMLSSSSSSLPFSSSANNPLNNAVRPELSPKVGDNTATTTTATNGTSLDRPNNNDNGNFGLASRGSAFTAQSLVASSNNVNNNSTTSNQALADLFWLYQAQQQQQQNDLLIHSMLRQIGQMSQQQQQNNNAAFAFSQLHTRMENMHGTAALAFQQYEQALQDQQNLSQQTMAQNDDNNNNVFQPQQQQLPEPMPNRISSVTTSSSSSETSSSD